MTRPALALVTPDRLASIETTTPSQTMRIAAERIAGAAARIKRITDCSFVTPEAKAQAAELRREVERLCAELRRTGL